MYKDKPLMKALDPVVQLLAKKLDTRAPHIWAAIYANNKNKDLDKELRAWMVARNTNPNKKDDCE